MPDENVPLNENPEHGGLTDEAMEAYLAGTQYAPAPTTDTGETEPAPSSPPAATSDEDVWEFEVAGQPTRITREQAQAYAEFEAFLAANPALAEAIGGTIQGTHQFMPVETPSPEPTAPATKPPGTPPAALTPPDALDLDDPVQRAVWERLVDTQTQLQQATERITRAESQLSQQQQETTLSLVNKSTANWREQHPNITDDDMDEIKKVTARLNVVPSLMSPVDPITGLPRQVDPVKALEDAYDLAAWQIPRLREQELANMQVTARNNNTRKKKLSSLGGSSGSVPRQPEKVPDNPQERRQAMIGEVANMLNGNWIQPEDK